LELAPSPNLLTNFDGRSFRPHEIIPSFAIQLGGNKISDKVEVVDAAIDYNLLLGCSWTYEMTSIVSSLFRVVQFPHEGNIITIDQLSYAWKNPNTSTGVNIP